MSEYEFTISLRIRHPSIEPSTITQTLGFEPQHTWKAGDPRRIPAGEAREGASRESYWMGRLMPGPELSSGRVTVDGWPLQTFPHFSDYFAFLYGLCNTAALAALSV